MYYGDREVKRGRGRVADDGATNLVKVTVSLPADVVEKAKRRGWGNVGRGLRSMLESLDKVERGGNVTDDYYG